MKKIRSRAGFTLIELSLAMLFVGVLSITVVMLMNNVLSSYHRGITLNQINTTGMDLVDDIRSAVTNSSADAVTKLCTSLYTNTSTARTQCENDGAYNFVSMTFKAEVKIGSESIGTIPVYGAFCTGTYSYIWASGYFDNSKIDDESNLRTVSASRPILRYRNTSNQIVTYGDEDGEYFRLLKVRDDYRAVCVSKVRTYSGGSYASNYYYASESSTEEKTNVYFANTGSQSNVFDISNGYGMVTEEIVDLLGTDEDDDLVLYDLAISQPAISTTQENMFYSGSFILGTIRGGINIQSSGQSCAVPENYAEEAFDYCAINKFSFAVQAGGE